MRTRCQPSSTVSVIYGVIYIGEVGGEFSATRNAPPAGKMPTTVCGRIAAKLIPPKQIREREDAVFAKLVLIRKKRSAVFGLHAENIEILRR